jgi:hypothetical protein
LALIGPFTIPAWRPEFALLKDITDAMMVARELTVVCGVAPAEAGGCWPEIVIAQPHPIRLAPNLKEQHEPRSQYTMLKPSLFALPSLLSSINGRPS